VLVRQVLYHLSTPQALLNITSVNLSYTL
jgi:hypothetical protein